MLVTVATILLCLLPSQVNGLITTDAKCLPGYEWMFSSIEQSPCDVAAELASVCITTPFNLKPLLIGYIYSGPDPANANSCRCSSVYYSLLSGCAYCQSRDHLGWSAYASNCSTVHVTVYPPQIPEGVKVPAYAYQNVVISDTFNVTLAYSVRGVESSRPPASSTQIPTPISSSSSSASASAGDSSDGGIPNQSPQIIINTSGNTPAIVGGVVGGVVGLGLIGALFAFLILRSKRKQKYQNNSSLQQQSPNMAFSPNTTASLIPSTTSPPPGFVHTTRPLVDPNMYDPHRQSLITDVTPNFTGGSGHNYVPSRQNTAGQYTGRPEL